MHHTGGHFLRIDAAGLLWLAQSNQARPSPDTEHSYAGVTATLEALACVWWVLEEVQALVWDQLAPPDLHNFRL